MAEPGSSETGNPAFVGDDTQKGGADAAQIQSADGEPGIEPNWHFALVHCMTQGDSAVALQGRTGLLMAVSWALAIAQVIAVMGIANTTIYGKCATNEQCVSGKYCYPNFGNDDAKGGNCQFCGSAPPLPIQYDGNGGVLNVAVHPDFVGHNETAVIELCHPPIVPTMGTSGLLTPWPFGARAVAST